MLTMLASLSRAILFFRSITRALTCVPPFFPPYGLAGASSLFLVQKVAAAYGGEEVQYSDTFLLQHIVTGLYLCWEGHGAQLSATSDYSDRCLPVSVSASACVSVSVSVLVSVSVSVLVSVCVAAQLSATSD